MAGKPIDEAVRAEFEAWARPKWHHPDDFDQRIDAPRGTYNNIEIQSAWEAWQALTAAQQQGQAEPPSAPVGVEGCLDRLRQHRSQRLWQADLVGGQISVERMRAILHVALAQQPAAVDGEAVERAVAWVSTADIAPFVGAPQMAEFWGTVTLASGPGDGRTVPLYLTAPPSALASLVGAQEVPDA